MSSSATGIDEGLGVLRVDYTADPADSLEPFQGATITIDGFTYPETPNGAFTFTQRRTVGFSRTVAWSVSIRFGAAAATFLQNFSGSVVMGVPAHYVPAVML